MSSISPYKNILNKYVSPQLIGCNIVADIYKPGWYVHGGGKRIIINKHPGSSAVPLDGKNDSSTKEFLRLMITTRKESWNTNKDIPKFIRLLPEWMSEHTTDVYIEDNHVGTLVQPNCQLGQFIPLSYLIVKTNKHHHTTIGKIMKYQK